MLYDFCKIFLNLWRCFCRRSSNGYSDNISEQADFYNRMLLAIKPVKWFLGARDDVLYTRNIVI